MNELTNENDIRRVLIKDRDLGFTMLVRAYQPGIYSGARRMTRLHEDAEEVAQDTFLRAYKALDGYKDNRIGDLRIRAWLWTIALNLCRDRWGSTTRESPSSSIAATSAPDDLPIDSAAWDRRFTRLSDDQRTAVVLRHVVDLPITEIAEITGRPEGTVKTDISRGLSRLRDSLSMEEMR